MTALAILGAIFGFAILITLSSVFDGYVLSILWGWFIVPTFGAPELSVAPAIGIALVVSYLTHQSSSGKKEDEELSSTIGKSVAMAILKPSFALFFGWIIQMFM